MAAFGQSENEPSTLASKGIRGLSQGILKITRIELGEDPGIGEQAGRQRHRSKAVRNARLTRRFNLTR
jgi:hypothetical protein